jgi:hypothetical protein
MTSADTVMSREQLLAKMRAARTHWESLLAQVPEARMTEPGVEGEWSLKDVIAHLEAYENWTASVIEKALRGEQYIPDPGADEMDVDKRNAMLYEQNRQRDLQEVLASSPRTFQRLLKVVQELSEEDLANKQLLKDFFPTFATDVPLMRLLVSNTYEHYDEHIPPLLAWLQATDAQ